MCIRDRVNPDGISSFDQASFAIQGLGILGGAPISSAVLGCTDPTAFNYDPSATVNDGSCIAVILGCTEPTANNTCNNSCNTDDGGCAWYGCTDPAATNTDLFTEAYAYNGGSTIIDDGSCIILVYGCTDPTAFNYDASANTDDGSCIAVVEGCLEPTANENYDVLVNTDNGTCVWRGCTDITANNYLWEGSTVDGLATGLLWHQAALNAGGDATSYTPLDSTYGMQNSDPNPCTYDTGCMDPVALNWDGSATIDDGSCEYCDWYPLNSSSDGSHIYTATVTDESAPATNDGEILVTIATTTPYTIVSVTLLNSTGTSIVTNALVTGATTTSFTNLAPGDYYIRVTSNTFTTDYGPTSCLWDGEDEGGQMHTVSSAPPFGCIDPTACNYCANCTTNAGMCDFLTCAGCTDPYADNYDASATIDDGSCTYTVYGCTDPAANNYDPAATVDDSSCTYDVYGCMDSRPRNDLATDGNGAYLFAATNYDPTATISETSASNSDNPCTYNTSASTIGDSAVGPAAGGYSNFLGYNAALENWTVKKNSASTAHDVWAVYNVSDLPLIRWPGYNADGSTDNSGSSSPATSGTRFSYVTARTSGCQGNINEYWGGNNQASGQIGFRWYYSTDDGDTWTDGQNWSPGTAVELVRFNKYVSSTCASSRIDWTTYPNGYDGKFKQDARFTFLEWDWNVGISLYVEQPQEISQYSESPYVNSGCKFSSYCNYDSSANFPTSGMYNPCGGGSPGCTDINACNGDPGWGCTDNTQCNYETWDVSLGAGYTDCEVLAGCSQAGYASKQLCCDANPNAPNC